MSHISWRKRIAEARNQATKMYFQAPSGNRQLTVVASGRGRWWKDIYQSGHLIFYDGASFACKLASAGTLGSSDTWHRNWHIGLGTLESLTFSLPTKFYQIKLNQILNSLLIFYYFLIYNLSCRQATCVKYLLKPSCAQNLQKFLWKVLHLNFSCIN